MTAFVLLGARRRRSRPNRRCGAGRAVLAAVALAVLLSAMGETAWAACDAIANPITISETQQINYGTIAVTNGGGTVTVSPSGTVAAPGGFTVSGIIAA